MPVWLKILLIIFLVGLIIVATAIFVGYRWVKSHEGELREMGAKTEHEGQEFGRGKDAEACVVEGLARTTSCPQMNMVCQVKASVFFQSCLQTATIPPGFCEGVPKQLNIMATVKWQMSECARLGHPNDQRCTRFMTTLQKQCDR